jgi:predicted RNase H-like HicB family nuclease
MKAEDRYLKFVRWSEEDRAYIGFCPDLFPWGAVCHGATVEAANRKLRMLVQEEVAELSRKHMALPAPGTQPIRDAVLA